jgi:putative salt-induced outer membrane protein YdiY
MRYIAALALTLSIQMTAFAQGVVVEKPEKKEVTWSNALFLEITGRTGQIEKKRNAGGITAIRKTEQDRLKLYAHYVWAEDSGVKTEEEYVAGADYEHNLSERTAWYARAEYENDGIEDLNHRITLATGLGYYFLKEERHKLRGRVGIFWRDEDYKGFDDTRNVGLEFGFYDQYHIREWGIWTTEVVYSPSLEDEKDWHVKYESTLALPFKGIEGLSMELGVSGLYKNFTPGPTEHYDTTYFVRLKYGW